MSHFEPEVEDVSWKYYGKVSFLCNFLVKQAEPAVLKHIQ